MLKNLIIYQSAKEDTENGKEYLQREREIKEVKRVPNLQRKRPTGKEGRL
jgi:hypothetical protein